MNPAVIWLGHLRRGDEPGTVVGELHDKWGWRVSLVGHRQEDGSYKLEGMLGEAPASLHIPLVDGPAKT